MATVIKPKRSFTTGSIPSVSDLEIGELAMNVADGKFYTKANANTVKEIGGASAVNIQSVLQAGNTATTDLALNNANIIFEGATANDFETTLTVTDPTADRTLTLPDETGTVATRGFAVAMAIAL